MQCTTSSTLFHSTVLRVYICEYCVLHIVHPPLDDLDSGSVYTLPLSDPVFDPLSLGSPELAEVDPPAAALSLGGPELTEVQPPAADLQQGGPVHDRLGPADVLHGLEHLKVHGLGPVAGLLAKVLPELAGAGEGLELGGVIVVVVVEEMLLVGQVAELVGGGHLELVVLHRRQHQCGILKIS